jgi:hypothetical protein
MNNLKLYHVNVSQQWYTEAEAFVWATTEDEAENVASRNIDLNSYDADSYGKDAKASAASFEFLDNLGNKECFYFFAPRKNGMYDDVNYETFKSYITPEDLEKMRIERIEKNNGQLPLLLEQ